MRIKDLATRATKLLTGNAWFVVDNGTKVEKVDYAELAKQIITEYNTQTLAGSAQSVKSALDALNSNTNRNYLTLETVDCNAVTTPGIKRISNSSTNSPDANTLILITTIPTGGQIRQEAYRQNNAEIFYVRAGYITNNAWYFDSWVKYPTRAEVDALNSNMALSAVPFTYASGVTSQSLFIRKSGSVVTVNGFVKFNSAPTASTEIGTIAAGNRPIDSVRTNAVMAEQAYFVGENAYFTIGDDGMMRVTPKAGNTYTAMYVSCSYHAQK